ncbi:MAG: hypothetical protein BGO51_01415 [Rhodospirillales bacterium 69-11]|nr:hypothetical protein [Rhodospirillales bacterium]MBN8928998.1 hypothetical protein [Rhodospirillales bacterium]OJW25659.1 MAG: hypothetical protein BGO51_01415 [Rhodospirillales bacterium 69-11]
MPNELSIQGVKPIGAAGDTTTDSKSDPRTFSPEPPPAMAPQPIVNPSLRLDAALGLVVIEFRDDGGAITSSIPSQRQLDAYRAHTQAPPAPDHSSAPQAQTTDRPATRAGPAREPTPAPEERSGSDATAAPPPVSPGRRT